MTTADLVYEHLKRLPEAVAAEVLDFVEFLEHKHLSSTTSSLRQSGSARKYLITMAEDFDAPLEDFEECMT
jgi:Protein of unknown function (DUF2281)